MELMAQRSHFAHVRHVLREMDIAHECDVEDFAQVPGIWLVHLATVSAG
jgi:hypothetical protein